MDDHSRISIREKNKNEGFRRWRSPSVDDAIQQIINLPPPPTEVGGSYSDLGNGLDVERAPHLSEKDFQSHREENRRHHQHLRKPHQKHKRHTHRSDHDIPSSHGAISEGEKETILQVKLPPKAESEIPDNYDSDEQRATFYVGSEPSIEKSSLHTPKKNFSSKLSSAFHAVTSPFKSVWRKTKDKEAAPTILLSPSHTMPSTTDYGPEATSFTKCLTDECRLLPSPATETPLEDKTDTTAQEKMKVSFAFAKDEDTTNRLKEEVPPSLRKSARKKKRRPGTGAAIKEEQQDSEGECFEDYNDVSESEDGEGLLQVFDIEEIASHRFGIPSVVHRHHKSLDKNSDGTLAKMDKRNGTDAKKLFDHEPHEIFVELTELMKDEQTGEILWRETARWIKYEEDTELRGGRWGKPHVSSLSFHSLLQLNYYLGSGSVILDLERSEFSAIMENIVEQLAITDQIKQEDREKVLAKLLLRHRHNNDKTAAGFKRRSSAASFYVTVPDKRSPSRNWTVNDMNHVANNALPSRETSILIPGSLKPPVESAFFHDENSKNKPGIFNRVPLNAEGVTVLVGALDFLERPAVAFVRLARGEHIPQLLEIPIPVRFFFVFLGPPELLDFDLDYHELGRSMSALMSNRNFHDAIYKAVDRREMLHAFNLFLDDSVVLPPGDMQNPSLIPLDEIRRKSIQYKKREMPSVIKDEEAKSTKFDPLKRTGRCFGGLINDVKNRYPWYLSDIKDAFNIQCLAATIFIYFAAISGAIAFGGLLGEKTGDLVGVPETLITTCVSGIVFALFACQPLIVLGTTGPVLLFDEILFQFSKSHSMDFLRMRIWVGLWTTIIATVLVAFDGSTLVRFFSRFMQEIFATIISMLFIYESIMKLVQVFVENPLQANYSSIPSNSSNSSIFNSTTNSTTFTPLEPKPNTALLSLLLTIGTFYIALFLRHFRNSKFLGRSARRALGDFGVPIAIAIMVGINFAVKNVYTQKLNVPDGLTPSNPAVRWWFISPWPIDILEVVTAGVAGLLLFILLFLETQICELILSKKERKTVKGSGFHFDMLLISSLSIVTSVIGGPWVCAATVRSISHVSSLTVLSKTHAPGETPHIVDVKEQRVTNFLVSLLIGVSVLMAPILQKVPVAVLFGVFLYMGISALSGIQLYERFLLLFMPGKHHPDFPYVRRVGTLKMHMYTVIQLVCIAVLWGIKSVSFLAPGFPFGLIALIFIHSQVKRLFTPEEFKALDGEEVDSTEDEPDFYEQIVA